MKKPIRIAIADNHPVFRKGIREIISEMNLFLVFETSNGRDLLEELNRMTILPNVCLMDISMPVMNGYDTLKRLKEKWPDIKTLVFSNFFNEYTALNILRLGACGYLLKSADVSVIQQALHDIHTKGFYYSDDISHSFFRRLHNNRKDILPSITERENTFLSFCCSELSYKEIATLMSVSTRTVEGYRNSLFEKFQLKTRTGLAMFAVTLGFGSVRNAHCIFSQ